jgi:uncharacterized protein (DUF433 family)
LLILTDYRNRIVVDSSVHFGKPCVAGTRIPVEAVMELVQESIPFVDIVNRYFPDLTIDQGCIKLVSPNVGWPMRVVFMRNFLERPVA